MSERARVGDAPTLVLEGMGVRFRDRPILRDVSLRIEGQGVVALMGPGGAGKSTLLRTIGGLNDGLSYMTLEGEMRYLGERWPEGVRPSVVEQKLAMATSRAFEYLVDNLPQRGELTRLEQREFLEAFFAREGCADLIEVLDEELVLLERSARRRIMILRQLLTDPALLCVDEPAAGLEDEATAALLDLIERQGRQRAVLFVTHNQRRARRVADHVVLLAGGRVVEQAPARDFFDAPRTEAARSYVRTGGCDVPSLDALEAAPATLDESTQPGLIHQLIEAPSAQLSLEELLAPAPGARAEAVGPNGFRWLVPGRLAGAPQPGLFRELSHDIEALARAGVEHLVTLTEEPLSILVDLGHGVSSTFFPIDDMHAPSIERAAMLCEQIAELLTRGVTVAFHCKAGIGRTGTMLGATLVWHGMDGRQALRALRRVDRRWVQSREQEEFLVEFGRCVHNDGPCPWQRPGASTAG